MSDSPTEDVKQAAPATEAVGTPTQNTPEASSDPGSERKTPLSTLDAVKAALSKKPETESSTVEKSPEKEGPENAEADDGEEFTGPPSKEELNRLHSKTRRRVVWYQEKVDGLERSLASLEPRAEKFDQIQKFVSEAGLSADEVNRTFETARQLKQDPWKALETLEPIVEQLRQITGRTLPNDLQEQARGGYISEAHASELAQRRAREAALQQQLERERQAASQQQQQAAQQAVITELSTWESSKSASDPDYTAKKSSFVQEALAAKWARGERPRTPQEAREQAEKTYAEVNQRLGALLPKPVEIKPVTGAAAPAAMPAPNSTLDVIRRVVGR